MAAVARLSRLFRLVEALQSGASLNSAQLAEHCRVSRRTIFRDLDLLRESGVPLRFDEQRQGYSLPTRTFLPPADFTLGEVLSLLVLCYRLGDRDRGIPFQHAARTAALKLLANLPRHLRESLGDLQDVVSARVEARNPLDAADHWYDLLTQALRARRQVRLRYQSLMPGEGEISTLLSPYHLLFHRRSWYVIGRSSLHRAVRTFNVGRILHAETLASTYRVPQRFSPERHFGNAWSMIRGRKRHEVVVRFRPLVAQNVAEVQWHRTQRVTRNPDGTLDFRATVDGLTEIRWWILGYGDQAEVLAPQELREMLKEHAAAMHSLYNGNGESR